MSHLLKFTVAVLLGVVAAAGNWLYLELQTSPTQYVAMAQPKERGDVLEEDDLVAVPVPGDAQQLRRTLIPYTKRSILFGAKATRDFERGDIVFMRDLSQPETSDAWEVVGPFQLISVGERFTRSTSDQDRAGSNMRGNTITIAVDADFGPQTNRLLSVIAKETANERHAAPAIVAVQVVPTDDRRKSANASSATVPANGLRTARSVNLLLPGDTQSHSELPQSVVYQTVSLEGIPNVPAVLLEGDLIRFVVPRMSWTK